MANNGLVIHAKPGEPIHLGREGENLARQVVFDLTRWEKLFGPGVAQLIAQRTGEATPYPVALTLDGSNVIWSVTAADTAIHGMCGKAELRYYVGETLAKSETWRTIVLDALGEPSEEPPEPQKAWVDQVLQTGVDAENAAQRAEEAAKRAESSGGGGGGTTDHSLLSNRDKKDQHPISAITGLQEALDNKITAKGITEIIPIDREDFNALTERQSTTVYLIRG